jgi:hypothetical protein
MALATGYAAALQGALGNDAKIYRYADALTTLWSNALPTTSPIVILWDRKLLGESSDDRLLEKHLTPLDWALAWSLKQACAKQSVPSIVIIDATAGNWKDTWAWSVRHQLLADMPWVTLSAPLVRKKDEPLYKWALSKAAMDNGGVAEDGVIRKNKDGAWELCPNPGAKKPDRAPLEGLNKLWTASLRLSDENHDINNIVGARVMLEMFSARRSVSKRTAPMRALVAKAKWSGLKESKCDRWALPNTQYLYGKTISAILVDDKHESGWAAFLEEVLGNDVQLRPMPTPDELIAFLQEQEDMLKRRDFIASISGLDENQDAKPEIIFLDLRLYGSGEAGRLKEDVKKLLAIAESWEGTCPAWDAIPQEELDEIRSWLEPDGSTSDTTRLKALLLLPRLLALALPLTPIILFSATGQAQVQKELKPYRNIFTNFQKPNPLADPASVQIAVSALHQALDFALPILRRRIQLAYVQKKYMEINALRPQEISTRHVELFFDEAGTNKVGIISTGVLAEFETLDHADQVQNRFLQNFDDGKVSWLRNSNSPSPPTEKLFKTSQMKFDDAAIEQQVSRLRKIVRDLSFHLVSAVGRQGADVDQPDVGKKSLAMFGDHVLDESIRLIVEYVLIVYMKFKYSDASTIGIFLPTRAGNNCGPGTAKRFGTDVDGENQTYNDRTAFPLIRGWLHGWGNAYDSEIAPKIMSLMSRRLADEDQRVDRQVFMWGRALHDLADWGAGFVGCGGDTQHKRSRLMRDTLNDTLFRSLHYSQVDAGNISGLRDVMMTLLREQTPVRSMAINQLCKVPLVEKNGDMKLDVLWESKPQEFYWLWRIFPFIETVSGDDLISGLPPLRN